MSVSRVPNRASVLFLAVVMALAMLPTVSAPLAASADDHVAAEDSGAAVVISQVYGGGGNSGAPLSHDYVELFNRGDTTASLAGLSIQYASATGAGNFGANLGQLTALPDVTLQPGQYYLVQQATQNAAVGDPLPTPDLVDANPINLAGANGKVALVEGTTTLGCNGGSTPCSAEQLARLVDLVGYGNADFFEGSGAAPTLSNSTAALRASDGCNDTDNNAADFTAATPAPRNTASERNPCVEVGPPPTGEPIELSCPTSPVGGRDVTTVQGYAAERSITATVADASITDLSVTVTPIPDSGSITLTDVDIDGGDASATLSLTDDLSPGVYTGTVTATADSDRQDSCTLSIEVTPLVPIGAVQGVIADGQTSFTSPLLNQRVAVQGVVTQLTRDSSGNRGFFLQNRPEVADGDPRSSDGIFVFTGNFTTLRTEAEGPATGFYGVTVGDELVLRGTVGQFFGNTQFSGTTSFVWEVTDTGLDVEDAIEIAEIDPPDDAGDSLRYFRRHLGMQMQVPADSVVVGGRDVFSGTDAEVWAIRGDHPVALRDDPYARRVFRDAHPLDNNPETNFDDGNGYRFVLGSFGLKGAANDPTAVLAPARTFDTITNDPYGGVYLSFGKYTVNVGEQLELVNGVDPADNAPVQAADRERELAVAAYNVENLYDYRDNPNSGCDFPGNPGCFADGASIRPPFDYVPASDAEYQARLQRMAEQIRVDLHGPDVVLIQETEAQDVCTVSDDWTPETGAALGADRLDCDLVNVGEANTKTDGRPDSSLELALVIAEQGGPLYDAAFDLDSGDLRGITQAYLYRTDRVELLEAMEDDPVLGSMPAVEYDGTPLPFNSDVQNPKALNAELPPRVADTCTSSGPTQCDGTNVFSRGAQVGLFRIWRDVIGTSTWTDVYLVNNHHSAGPDRRVFQRREQATYNARIAEAVLDEDPDARVLVGGDLNVFPRPDDPFAPGQPIALGEVGPSDQLRALYESPLTNLYDTLVDWYPAAAYTFGFQGQAQTLDHLFVSPTLLSELVDVRSAKINVDWPADAAGEVPAYGRFGVSDHDPEAGTFDAISFERVRELIEELVASGELNRGTANGLLARLDNAERFLARGQQRQAVQQLQTVVRQLSTPRGGGTGELGRYLAREFELLIELVS